MTTHKEIPQHVSDFVRRAKEESATMEWIGVDLDATLARWDGWNPRIGPPIPEMLAKVKAALAAGKTVKIFTARVCRGIQPDEQRQYQFQMIREWCLEHIGQELEVTNEKDFYMSEYWDDRAKQVVPNTGVFLEDTLFDTQPCLAQLTN